MEIVKLSKILNSVNALTKSEKNCSRVSGVYLIFRETTNALKTLIY